MSLLFFPPSYFLFSPIAPYHLTTPSSSSSHVAYCHWASLDKSLAISPIVSVWPALPTQTYLEEARDANPGVHKQKGDWSMPKVLEQGRSNIRWWYATSGNSIVAIKVSSQGFQPPKTNFGVHLAWILIIFLELYKTSLVKTFQWLPTIFNHFQPKLKVNLKS